MFNPIQNASDHLALSKGCYFEPRRGESACRFVETFCRQSKGEGWGGQPIELIAWERDFLMRLFGWRQADGRRRFRSAYIEIAKKNGKSTLVSALSLLMTIADGEPAPETYLNAVDRKQANLVYEEAARMVEQSPDLLSRLDVKRSAGTIVDPVGYGKIQKNSADAPSADGVNASLVVFDELHRLKKRALWDVMRYAGASRKQPLRVAITTAGDEAEGPWFEQREYSEKVNAGVIEDVTHLGIVYRALPDDDLDDPATWRKANPSMGITIDEDEFAREWAEAKLSPTSRANFLRLRLNIVAAGPQQFIEVEKWDKCGAAVICDADEPTYAGLDLSESQDLAALVDIRGDNDRGIDVRCQFWLPQDNIRELEDRHQQPYREWARVGLITLTPGDVIDYEFIRRSITILASQCDLRKVMVDPYNANKLSIELKEQDGLPVEFVRQGFLSLSDPTKQLLRFVLSGKLRHGGNQILRWHASNAVVVRDSAGNIKLHKEKSKKKIDGMSALVNAIAGMNSDDTDTEPSVYESRGPIFMSW